MRQSLRVSVFPFPIWPQPITFSARVPTLLRKCPAPYRRAPVSDDPGMDDDERTDFLAVYAEVCADAGIDPLTADALAVLAEAMLAAGITCH